MRIKLDENVPHDAVAVSVNGGHDVHTIPDEDLVGHPDADVWAACVAERRMLVTFDLGFGDIRVSAGNALRCRRSARHRPAAGCGG